MATRLDKFIHLLIETLLREIEAFLLLKLAITSNGGLHNCGYNCCKRKLCFVVTMDTETISAFCFRLD